MFLAIGGGYEVWVQISIVDNFCKGARKRQDFFVHPVGKICAQSWLWLLWLLWFKPLLQKKWWLKWKLYSMFQNQRTAFQRLTAQRICWKRATANIPIFILCLPVQPSARWLLTVMSRQIGRRCSRPTLFYWPARMRCGRIASHWTGYWWGWTQFLQEYWRWWNISKKVIFTSNLSGYFYSATRINVTSLKQSCLYRFYFLN